MPRKTGRKDGLGRAGDGSTGIVETLSHIPGITVIPDGEGYWVRCERIGVAMRFDPNQVLRQQLVTDPFGDPALLLLLDLARNPVQVVVSSSDLVFQPDDSVPVGDIRLPLRVENMPPMVGYSEVLRDLEGSEATLAAEANIDRALGTLAMLRYFLAGAERLDIDCAELMVRWRRLWDRFSER